MTPNNDILAPDVSIRFKKIPENIEQLLAFANKNDLHDISDVKSPSRKAEMLATRLLIRETFNNDTRLEHHADGSPFLTNVDCQISISHCRGIVAIAYHPRLRIGIDIERWRNTLLRVKNKFLSADEMEHYDTPDMLLTAWTAKEAVYKAFGHEGLDFASDISLSLDTTKKIASARFNGEEKRFYLYSQSDTADWTVLTVAVPVIL